MHLLPDSKILFWNYATSCRKAFASLIGCTQDSLPPLGPYLDFMDRLWAAPVTGIYARDKLLPASWNRKKPNRPKGKRQKAQETTHRITESIEKRLMAGKDIPFNFEQRLQQFLCHVAVLPSMECSLIPEGHLDARYKQQVQTAA